MTGEGIKSGIKESKEKPRKWGELFGTVKGTRKRNGLELWTTGGLDSSR